MTLGRRLFFAALVFFLFARVARGEDPVVKVQAVDSIPTAWCYAALAAVSAAGVTLGGVITKLYFNGLTRDKECEAQGRSDATALATEKDARREQVEKLLREHTVLLKETLAATAAKTEAYVALAAAVDSNTKATNDLIALVGQK